VDYFVKALLCALCHPYVHSGVTGSLSQEWKNLAEGGPLATVRGHYRTLRKKLLRNDSEFGSEHLKNREKKTTVNLKNTKCRNGSYMGSRFYIYLERGGSPPVPRELCTTYVLQFFNDKTSIY